MKKIDKIYDIALDNYGVVTAKQAKDLGVYKQEITRFVKDGRLNRIARNTYVIDKYIPTEYDIYNQATEIVGEDAYLVDTAVLSMLKLAFLNPKKINVATHKRIRKQLPHWIYLKQKNNADKFIYINGIRCQRLVNAMLDCRNVVMPDRLLAGANEALERGYLTNEEYKHIKGVLNNEKA